MKAKVLFLEQGEQKSSSVLKSLKSSGYSVDHLSQWSEALQFCQVNNYEILVLDCRNFEEEAKRAIDSLVAELDKETFVILWVSAEIDDASAFDILKSTRADRIIQQKDPSKKILSICNEHFFSKQCEIGFFETLVQSPNPARQELEMLQLINNFILGLDLPILLARMWFLKKSSILDLYREEELVAKIWISEGRPIRVDFFDDKLESKQVKPILICDYFWHSRGLEYSPNLTEKDFLDTLIARGQLSHRISERVITKSLILNLSNLVSESALHWSIQDFKSCEPNVNLSDEEYVDWISDIIKLKVPLERMESLLFCLQDRKIQFSDKSQKAFAFSKEFSEVELLTAKLQSNLTIGEILNAENNKVYLYEVFRSLVLSQCWVSNQDEVLDGKKLERVAELKVKSELKNPFGIMGLDRWATKLDVERHYQYLMKKFDDLWDNNPRSGVNKFLESIGAAYQELNLMILRMNKVKLMENLESSLASRKHRQEQEIEDCLKNQDWNFARSKIFNCPSEVPSNRFLLLNMWFEIATVEKVSLAIKNKWQLTLNLAEFELKYTPLYQYVKSLYHYKVEEDRLGELHLRAATELDSEYLPSQRDVFVRKLKSQAKKSIFNLGQVSKLKFFASN